MPEVIRSIEIKAPPSAVWRWMATPEALRRWLSPNLQIDLRVGGSYRFRNEETETRWSLPLRHSPTRMCGSSRSGSATATG